MGGVMSSPSPPVDSGSGTVLAVAMVAVVLAGVGIVSLGWRVQVAQVSARTAADLSALAAAQCIAMPDGMTLAPDAQVEQIACRRAGEAAELNDAVLVSCVVEEHGVVRVRVRTGGRWSAVADARAGPTSAR